MNTSHTHINASGDSQPQDENHDGHQGKTSLTDNRLLVVIEGDYLAIKALMERLVALQCPIGDEGDGLAWIEVPSRYCYFVFAGIKILGDPWMWQTSQLELDAESVSTNRIVVCRAARGSMPTLFLTDSTMRTFRSKHSRHPVWIMSRQAPRPTRHWKITTRWTSC